MVLGFETLNLKFHDLKVFRWHSARDTSTPDTFAQSRGAIYVCVDVYICVYVCVYIYIYICVYIYIYVNTYTSLSLSLYIYIYIHTHKYIGYTYM